MRRVYFDTRPVGHGAWGGVSEPRPLVNPWFVALASRPRMCPRCHATTVWSGTLNPDAAYESCPRCGWLQTQVAPEGYAGSRCAPVGAESAIPVDLSGDPPQKAGEVIRFRPRA